MAITRLNGPLVMGDKQAGISGGPNTGYVSLSQNGTITQNSTNAVDLAFYVPVNSRIIDILVDVVTAFDSVTSATLTVGTASAGTQYAGSVNAKTAGRTRPTFSGAQLSAMSNVGSNTTVVATVTPVGATTAGSVLVTLVYAQTDSVL